MAPVLALLLKRTENAALVAAIVQSPDTSKEGDEDVTDIIGDVGDDKEKET
jgi:hypothetical protein